jgi:ComF family protein
MFERFGHQIAKDVLIVPVPTATRRVRGRGYDQAVLLARAFAKRAGCQYAPLLLRIGAQEQIGANKAQRRDQLQGVIYVKNDAVVQNMRILLIDDVMTTGATLETAAHILKQAGAKVVGSLVFARAEMKA